LFVILGAYAYRQAMHIMRHAFSNQILWSYSLVFTLSPLARALQHYKPLSCGANASHSTGLTSSSHGPTDSYWGFAMHDAAHTGGSPRTSIPSAHSACHLAWCCMSEKDGFRMSLLVSTWGVGNWICGRAPIACLFRLCCIKSARLTRLVL